MTNIVKNAIKLTWDEISPMLCSIISAKLGRTAICKAEYQDYHYWDVVATVDTFTLEELKMLLKYVGGNEDTYLDCLPTDSVTSKSIGMGVSEKLLAECIGTQWDHTSICEDGIWLIGIDVERYRKATEKSNVIYVDGCFVDTTKLRTKDELMAYLESTDGMGSDLDEFCQSNWLTFGSKLFWFCPIPSQHHEGYYFALVREGILSLPYNHVFDRDEELALGDAELFDANAIFDVRKSLEDFTDETKDILDSLAEYALKRGGKNEEA